MNSTNNINDIINNQALINAVNAHKERQNVNTQAAMSIELVKAKFFTPVETAIAPDENGNLRLDRGKEIKFNVINTPEGDMYLLAFTSWDELEKWRERENRKKTEEQQTVLLKFANFEKMLFEGGNLDCKGFVIDPFGMNVVLSRRNMIAVREVLEEIDYEEEEEQPQQQQPQNYEEKNVVSVKVSELKDCPKELSDAIKEHIQSEIGIKTAYLQSLVKGEEPGFLVALEYEGDMDKIFKGVLEAARPHIPSGYSIDIVPCETDLKEFLKDKTKPFFER